MRARAREPIHTYKTYVFIRRVDEAVHRSFILFYIAFKRYVPFLVVVVVVVVLLVIKTIALITPSLEEDRDRKRKR